MFDGFLIIDKPAGWTSHDVVGRLRKILRTKRIGHTGTLDPFATGVLVMMVGKATRLAQFLGKDIKEYKAIVQFGFETDTGDLTGKRKAEEKGGNGKEEKISSQEIEQILPDFRGEIEQTPPMYSAKKIAGKKLYELARKGIEIERKPVKVNIYELEILSTQHSARSTQHFAFRVMCSAGTYIRTLAEDIGRKIGTGAHLAELRRTRAGKYDLSKAVTIEKLEDIVLENKLDEIIISMNEAVSHLPQISLSEVEIAKTRTGLKLKRNDFEAADNQSVRMTDAQETLVAIGLYDEREKTIQPKIVLV